MANVVVDGILVSYQKIGKGNTVLLLHGWGDSMGTFTQLSKHLSEKNEVITLDLPGFGGTQSPGEAWDLDSYANFVTAFLTKINITKIYAIIGHSNGGAIAVRGVSLRIFSPKKLVLLASSGVRSTNLTPKLAIVKVGKGVSKVFPKKIQQKIKRGVYVRSGSDILVAPHLEQTFRKIVQQDIQGDLHSITIPALLIYGSKDQDTPPVFGEILQSKIKNSKLVIIEGAGHFVHHDAPGIVQSELEGFLGGQVA